MTRHFAARFRVSWLPVGVRVYRTEHMFAGSRHPEGVILEAAWSVGLLGRGGTGVSY
jgi:hypothetical protein